MNTAWDRNVDFTCLLGALDSSRDPGEEAH